MTNSITNEIILRGGFAGLLLEINKVQKTYRAKLDAEEQALWKLEQDFKSGFYTPAWQQEQAKQINARISDIERQAAGAVRQAENAFRTAVDRFHKPDPLMLDDRVCKLLDSGILTKEEYQQLAADNAGNPTLYRLIAQKANQRDVIVPMYQAGVVEKKILADYMSATQGMILRSSDSSSFMNAWNDRLLSQAVERLNRISIRPSSKPMSLEELIAKAEEDAESAKQPHVAAKQEENRHILSNSTQGKRP